ncbi:helix-turn-helix domain-containing protein [Candidatus Nomurabacteria bacterium]|nr:helix-turn-helix domain-containing protein [Candidatus Nomurabacteria bacterium]
MRKDKEFIFRLRREGKPYRDIQKATGVSRGTLCRWFKEEDWSKHLTTKHSNQSIENARNRMIRINMVRKLKLQYQYALIEKEAEKEYEIHKRDPLFWAGLMLYVGEGDKTTRNLMRLSSSDVYINKIFIQFCRKYLDIKRDNLRCSLALYEDNNKPECINTWSKELNLNIDQFYKPQIINKKSPKRLQFGICTTIISNTAIKTKLLKWLSLAQVEEFENAVMV